MTQQIPQGAYDLYDKYAHGLVSRRDFLEGLQRFAIGGLSAAALASALLPDYANAQQTNEEDDRLIGEKITYASPKGAGEMGGYLVRPKNQTGPLPGVIVIHENRGLNPHIADVARRAALEGFVAFAPDALFPLGGWPGNDDDGRTLMSGRKRDEMFEDFVSASQFLHTHDLTTDKLGCSGFCYGGSVTTQLALRLPELAAAAPFYGGCPSDTSTVANINAKLMFHFAGLDERVNGTWPSFEGALKAAGKPYSAYIYENTNHGFHNDTTARFDKDAAALAWQRTIELFNSTLKA